MVLYHGSNTGGIKTLEPRLADHERPYVYLSTIEIVAGFYMINAVSRPYYWFPYGFGKDGTVEYHELFPGALREAAEGKSGFIYMINAQQSAILPFKNIPCARLGTAPMEVVSCSEIADCYAWLLNQRDQGAFRLMPFEEKSPEELAYWYDMIFHYIAGKNMIETPDCSYAVFVKRKFHAVWDRYESECARGKQAKQKEKTAE